MCSLRISQNFMLQWVKNLGRCFSAGGIFFQQKLLLNNIPNVLEDTTCGYLWFTWLNCKKGLLLSIHLSWTISFRRNMISTHVPIFRLDSLHIPREKVWTYCRLPFTCFWPVSVSLSSGRTSVTRKTKPGTPIFLSADDISGRDSPQFTCNTNSLQLPQNIIFCQHAAVVSRPRM